MQTDRQPQGTGLRLKMAGFRSYFENNGPFNIGIVLLKRTKNLTLEPVPGSDPASTIRGFPSWSLGTSLKNPFPDPKSALQPGF